VGSVVGLAVPYVTFAHDYLTTPNFLALYGPSEPQTLHGWWSTQGAFAEAFILGAIVGALLGFLLGSVRGVFRRREP
jgi:hypothetical protein